MKHLPLDIYDDMPPMMQKYLSHYGWHFNKKAFEIAVKMMRRKNPTSGKLEPIEPWTKEQVEEMLTKYGITLENSIMYDAAYVANMCKADYYKSSVPDEAHVALYVKDVLDDVDGRDDLPFRFWTYKNVSMGLGVEFADLL